MASPDYYIPSTTDYDNYYIDSPDTSQQHSNLNNNIMVVAIVVLFCAVLIITSLHIYGKWASRYSHRNTGNTRHFLNQNQGNSNAQSTGLSKDAIAELPTFIYKAPASSDLEAGENVGLLECAVCLSEFQEEEQGRLLPSCKHSFHIECIDMWFYSHSTCPLCRAVVMPTITTSPLIPISISTHEQQQEAEGVALDEAQHAIEATSSTHESIPLNETVIPAGDDNAANAMAQIPTNVLFCGDSIRSMPSQLEFSQSSKKPSELASSSSSSSRSTRSVPHITIEIPKVLDISLASPSWMSLSSRRSRCASPYGPENSSLKYLKSPPSLRESLKRMLSIQSSKGQKAFTISSQEGNMESPSR